MLYHLRRKQSCQHRLSAIGVATVPSPYLTNNNSDWSYGAGVRVGWIGDITPTLTLGASAASKIYMTEFDDYRELFAEQGDLDIPANFALSATVKATPKLNLSFDFQRILYEGVNSISNDGPVASRSGPFFLHQVRDLRLVRSG